MVDSIFFLVVVTLNLKDLKEIIPIKSIGGNTYMCSLKNKKTFLVHPLIQYLYNLHKQGTDVKSWYDNIVSYPVKIEGLSTYSREEIAYNMSKFQLMLQEDCFDSYNSKNRISKKITTEDIKTGLANVDHVIFELTDKCNLNCTYCGYGKYYDDLFGKRTNNYLNPEVAKTFLKNLFQYWNSSYNSSHGRLINISFYGGEPLLNFSLIKDLVSFVKSYELKHNKINFSISTNGVLINKHLDYIVENGINLAISLDGDKNANSFRVFHNNKESYSRIIKNLELIKKKYPIFYKEKISFCSVLHSRNSVEGIYEYFKKEHHIQPGISGLKSDGLNKKYEKEFVKMFNHRGNSFKKQNKSKESKKDLFNQTPEIQGASSFIHKYNNYCFNNYNDLYFNKQGISRTPTRTCVPFSKKIFLTVNGKLLPCETISHDYSLGNVTQDHFNVDFEAIEKKYELYFEKIRKQCDQCYYIESCHKCIFDFDINGEKIVCDTFMNKDKFSAFLSNQLNFIETNPENYSVILEDMQYE